MGVRHKVLTQENRMLWVKDRSPFGQVSTDTTFTDGTDHIVVIVEAWRLCRSLWATSSLYLVCSAND